MRLIDFGVRKIPADAIKAAGYDGVVVCVSDSQPGANSEADPFTREYVDALRAAGLNIISNFRFGKPIGAGPSDFTRGFDGGIEDARTAVRLHTAAGGPDSAPIIFSIDEDIDLATWDGIAVEWFRGINCILGVERTGIYGHSRVCAWAIRDGVVGHSTTPERRWVWQTRAWSCGEREPAAVVLQDVIDTASNPGPSVDGERVNVNEVLAVDFGQWDLDRSLIAAIPDFGKYSTSAPPAPGRTSGEAYPGSAVAQGVTGRHVTMIQDRLNTVTEAGLLVDGEFAPLTTSAVAAYQKSRGLVPDGEIGPTTWAELFSSPERIFPKAPGWRARAIAAPAKDVTGPAITTSVAMEAADLGILRWDPDRKAIAAMFGDNFDFDGMTGDWYSPSIVMYDKDYNVLGIPALNGAVPTIRPNARRRQLWRYDHNNKEYSTILPCDYIRIGDWWHVAVMVTAGLGHELRTEFHRSRDLVNWEVRPELSLPHHPRPLHPGNVMLTFDRIGDYVYIFGTGGLARNKPIWMWRNKAGEFPLGRWEPWGWDGARWDWGIANERSPILGGKFGELCFRYLQGNCVLSFFDAAGYKQQARTVQRPEDNWVDGANVVDYVLGTEIPNPYGGYISPLSRLNEWNGMHFWVSQWPGPPHRRPYKVYLAKDTLLTTNPSIVPKEGEKSDVIDGMLADKDRQAEEFEPNWDLRVDAFPRDSDVTAVAAGAWPVESQLTDGPGIFGYYSAHKRYGTASTIAALYEVGRIWRLRRAAPRVGVGDISLRGGGDIEGHASHETGRDVDLRPMKNDGTEGPVTWAQAAYSRSLTQELIDIIYANGVVQVKVIGFNDPGVQGCVNWVNHDNHLHVRFYFQDESPGYPLLKFGMNNSPPVRECQRRLNNWKQMHGDPDRLTPDGDFGQNTLQAVQDFQDSLGLVVDGKVGNDTWKRTLDYLVSDRYDPATVTQEVNGAIDWAQDLRRTLAAALTQLAHVDAIGIDAPYSDVLPVLRPGSIGDAVGMLQAMLRALQFDLDVDRYYGPATSLGVKVFQRDSGLRADGVVGPMTWDALKDAAAAASDAEPRRYWPVGRGHIITSPWDPRPGGFHKGTDFGFPGGSAGKPVYAVQSGTVQYAGPAQGYGGPDPAGWLVIDSSRAEGGGCVEYGHIIREVAKGAHVAAGQRIAHINPSNRTNGGVAPHLHLSVMPRAYDPGAKINPVPWLGAALTPEAMPAAATAEQTLSEEGVRFIAGFEGFSPRLYNDPGGHCTIGYGHLVHHGRCNGNEPEDFKRGITRDQGLALLGRDADVAERAVNRQVQVVLTQYQFDALVSFVFNVGAGAFGGSTLLRRLNGGEYDAVPTELRRWVYSGGKQLPGLVRRRKAEGVLFSQGGYGDVEAPADGDISEGPYALVDAPADSDI